MLAQLGQQLVQKLLFLALRMWKSDFCRAFPHWVAQPPSSPTPCYQSWRSFSPSPVEELLGTRVDYWLYTTPDKRACFLTMFCPWNTIWSIHDLFNSKRLSRLAVAEGDGGSGGWDWESGISRCRCVITHEMDKLYSAGNCIQHPVINPNGKEYGKNIYV